MRSKYVLPPAILVLALLAVAVGRVGADTIHFRNRSVLNNVEVVSEDWRGVQVQLSETVRMSFLRKDIAKVERQRLRQAGLPGRREHTGDRVPSGLRQKLTQSIAVNYEEPTSFVDILDNISEVYEMNITVNREVRERVTDGSIDPLWTFTKQDGSNVLQMLEKLVADKGLRYDISDGSILISVSGQPAAAEVSQLAPPTLTRPAPARPTPTRPVPTVRRAPTPVRRAAVRRQPDSARARARDRFRRPRQAGRRGRRT